MLGDLDYLIPLQSCFPQHFDTFLVSGAENCGLNLTVETDGPGVGSLCKLYLLVSAFMPPGLTMWSRGRAGVRRDHIRGALSGYLDHVVTICPTAVAISDYMTYRLGVGVGTIMVEFLIFSGL
jgi:hypothetical protein